MSPGAHNRSLAGTTLACEFLLAIQYPYLICTEAV